MASIKDIASLAGVSRGTVDRVLNNRGNVSPETAEKVMKVVKALDYSPNRAGKILAVKKKELKFGFILFSSTSSNPFFLDLVKGIDDKVESLSEFGVTVEVRFATIDNPDLQVKLIDELLDEGIDGLVIAPINHDLVINRLKKLTATGFPVITANSDIPDCGRLAYVGSNYYQSGETAAGLMNLVCHGETNLGIIMGSPWVHCHSQRVAGFMKNASENYPNINILETAINNDDDLESYAVTCDLIEKYPEMNALYLAAAGVEGACKAVEYMGKKGKINVISYDDTPPTCKLVEDGSITATIAQQAFIQGSKPLDLLLDYVGMDEELEKEFYYTNIEIKIKENINS